MEYTTEQVREKFLTHVGGLIPYWAKQEGTVERRLEGLAFSLLVLLDGGVASLPKFIVAPDPHPTDRAFHQENGENWFPENHEASLKSDISGCLHELLRNKPQTTVELTAERDNLRAEVERLRKELAQATQGRENG
jgi:hypothetical protein